MSRENQDKQQDHSYKDLISDSFLSNARNKMQNKKQDPILLTSKTDILKKYKSNDIRSIYKRILPNGDSKEVFHIILPDSQALVLKVEEFGSQRMRKYKSMYREYFIGKTLGAICNNVAKTYDLQEVEIGEGNKIRAELLTEYGGVDFIKNELKPGDSLKAGYQLLSALKLMEERGVSHLDIKPENIVWDSKTNCLKLIDFGTSISFYRNPGNILEEIGEYEDRIIGFTADFCPPELHALTNSKSPLRTLITQKIDAFAFGITFYEMLLSEHKIPIKRMAIKNKEMLDTYLTNMRLNLQKINKGYLFEILENCASYNPRERLTFAELFKELALVLNDVHKEETIKRTQKCIDYVNLAEEYENIGDFDSALWFYEQELKKKSPKQDLSDLFNKIGVVYYMLNLHELALSYLKKAEVLNVKLYGKTHPNTGLILLNIGKTFGSQGKAKLGLKYFFRALHIFKKFYKEDHPYCILAYNFIGISYIMLGKYDYSILYIEKVRAIVEPTVNKYDPYLVVLYSELANSYYELGNVSKTNQYIQLTEEGLEHCSWNINSQIEKGYIGLAYLLFNSGNYNGAIKFAKKAIAIIRKNLGEDCFFIYDMYSLIGDSNHSLGNLESAIENYNNAKENSQHSQKTLQKRIEILNEKIICVKIQGGNLKEVEKILQQIKDENI